MRVEGLASVGIVELLLHAASGERSRGWHTVRQSPRTVGFGVRVTAPRLRGDRRAAAARWYTIHHTQHTIHHHTPGANTEALDKEDNTPLLR